MATDFAKIQEEIKQITAEIAEVDAIELKDDVEFAEMGIDSMMALEIAAAIEKKYKVVIPEEDIPTLRSLQNVYQLLETLLKK
ncbi:MAG: acyl carrier protein [Candidatus Omnitrophica bacterium]|nr:acyl carrier protein [Candidatus Omnitrophota bacterium]